MKISDLRLGIFHPTYNKPYVLRIPYLEKEINDFLGSFYTIKSINFTYLRDNTILCSYEGETWEAYHDRAERTFSANDAIRPNYDQMKDSYQ